MGNMQPTETATAPFTRKVFDEALESFDLLDCPNQRRRLLHMGERRDDWTVRQLLSHVQRHVQCAFRQPSCDHRRVCSSSCRSVADVYRTTCADRFTRRGGFKQQLVQLQKERFALVQAADTLAVVVHRADKLNLGRKTQKQFAEYLKQTETLGADRALDLLEAAISGNVLETQRLAFAFYNEFLKCR